jgi:hypothetical protein
MTGRGDVLTAVVDALKSAGVPAAVGPKAWDRVLDSVDRMAAQVARAAEAETARLERAARRLAPTPAEIVVVTDGELAASVRAS